MGKARKEGTSKSKPAEPTIGRGTPEAYAALGIDDLCLYAVWSVLDRGETCTFERLVAECYTLFPDKFSLQGYPQWPDSARVNKSWLRCRTDRGWIAGSTREGFHLTPAGRERACAVEARLLGRNEIPQAELAAGELAMLRALDGSSLFRVYLESPEAFAPTEMEVRALLRCTAEAPIRVVRENLHLHMHAARAAGRHDLEEFLKACGRRLSARGG